MVIVVEKVGMVVKKVGMVAENVGSARVVKKLRIDVAENGRQI